MQRFYKIFAIIFALKCLLGVLLPLSSDEAYYWFWGQHPQLSYYDHPAMVAWLYWLGSIVDHAFGVSHLQFVRLPAIFLGQATLFVWALILKKFLSEKELIAWLAFAALAPLWGLGSIIVTPDTPVLLFWSLSIYFFMQIDAREPGIKRSTLDWYYVALGASLGLGFCSKYHIVIFLPVALAYVLVEKRWHVLNIRGLLWTNLSGLLFCLPVLVWNSRNDFMSFRFQLHHGLDSGDEWTIRWFIEYVLGQFFIIFPTVAWATRRLPQNKTLRMLAYFGWGPVVFFALTSLRSHVEANWPIVAYPALVSLGYIALKGTRALRWTVGIWGTAWVLLMLQIFHPWIPLPERDLKTYEIKKYDPLIPIFEKNQDGTFASSYQMASMISYKTRFTAKHPLYKLKGMSRLDYFDFIDESTPPDKPFNVLLEREQYLSTDLLELNYLEIGSERIDDDFRIGHISRAPSAHARMDK